jgi:epoxide hydrolase-like predicted phosphatase
MPVRNVIFDFGGVLVRWKPREIIERFYADESVRAVIGRAILEHVDWTEMDRGTLDEITATRRFSERAGRPLEEIAAFLQHVRESLTLVPETVTIIQDLAARGIPIYGLSNMAPQTFAWLRERYDVWSTFTGIVISGHIRMIKPDPEIFAYISEQHGLSPAETVFIDDHTPNVEAARRLGFITILFETPQQCAADLTRLLGKEART